MGACHRAACFILGNADHDVLLDSLGTGASVAISGKWQPAPPFAEQSYELKAEELHILGGTEKANA